MSQAIWSDKAKEDYWNNIDYLLEDFTALEATNFIEKVDAIITIIEKSPKTFQKSEYKKIHFVPVFPQITLFYLVNGKKPVTLVRFWNNKKDPAKFSI
ncbi:MAG: type II toxin-antitoxin system RelE/ParE family toxin [Crocinitomicaceae bacterium]|nr:type II toxin-antitoxin system RelE/ParE family toxin [Crocinitomicaceae bacterium]MBL4861677.1 type II toxin-antitoxin system RelE/ParE family toxin [Crocinitomicaceae bacterium]